MSSTSSQTVAAADTFAFFLYDGRPRAQPNSGGIIFRHPIVRIGFEGKFTIKRDTITVTFGSKKKTTQLGGMDPLNLAEMLMSELMREVHADAA
ncbi:hypothetical protein [Cypionkella psychrotolerans]|uniref:hypothetical protein n=1 Tax=Cypionkella psychrotolerans TaxID=1678131 RepID=UPI0006B4975B|nr:hypothetical protein [Cypionkella psychrotolerans]